MIQSQMQEMIGIQFLLTRLNALSLSALEVGSEMLEQKDYTVFMYTLASYLYIAS